MKMLRANSVARVLLPPWFDGSGVLHRKTARGRPQPAPTVRGDGGPP